jgi:hypothetical protein
VVPERDAVRPWALIAIRSPDSLSEGYAQRYGLPQASAQFDFVETGVVPPGANLVTREAPGVIQNLGCS